MIKIFTGYNRDEIRSVFTKEKKEWSLVETVDSLVLNELALSQNIFNENKNYLVSEFPEKKDDITKISWDVLIKSPNIFYFESLAPKSYFPKKLESYINQKVEKVNKKQKTVDAFVLSDTVFSKGAQHVWVVFNRIKKQLPIEEIHGTFLWAIKTIVLSKDKESRKTVNSFVLSKITGPIKDKDIDFLKDYYEKALMLSIKAHRGDIEFEKGFERLILTLPR